jgi:molybdopterin synthase sulfur carrier subunit
MIRVVLPFHLRTIAKLTGEAQVEVAGPVTSGAILDALEAKYPALQGTMRDHTTKKRRDFLRFYACEQDFSTVPPNTPLPEKIANGEEPFLVIGALAGG